MKNSILQRGITRLLGSACTAFLIGGAVTSCSDDLLTGQPSWLGESIYAELERRGDFKETLKLINAQSEDYKSVLQKTGSKTLFVADDAAWKDFYANNPWGVTSIESMTEAQKRLLFKANMINSAYLVELLGNIPTSNASADPIEGQCMRRTTSVDLMDSVPLVKRAHYPEVNPARFNTLTGEQVDYWSRVRGKDSVLVLQDDGVATMIHFMPKFMLNNNISSEDVAFLTNGEISSNQGAFVNGKVITEKDITCQNGYIHVLEGVATPLDNLANVIASELQFSIYHRLLDRFSYPHYDEAVSREYQRQYGGKDSVFVKRYFNKGHASNAFGQTDEGVSVTTQLNYDPGWNRYRLNTAGVNTYQYDGAVMLVPTDQALLDYLENEGADLKIRYDGAGPGLTAWDNAPDKVVLPLLNNTMLPSLKAAIPSQFASINNSASDPMGVEKADIDKVIWACNGVVYQTNKVYVAPEYVSVYYPCVIRGDEDLNLTYTVVDNDSKVTGGEGFYAYLNNMGSKYSFIIPTDNALQTYYDPVSRYRTSRNGSSTSVAYKFYVNTSGYIAAYPYLVDWSDEALDEYGRGKIADTSTDQVTLSSSGSSSGDAFNHFKDILNSSLTVGLFKPGQRFYQGKNGSPIIVEWNGDQVIGVAGSFQYERNYFVPVTEVFEKSEEGNGRSYIIDQEPLMSTFTSPYAALTDSLRENDFGVFANLMASSGQTFVEDNQGMRIEGGILRSDDGSSHTTVDQALSLLDNYHYTIYVPTNESIQQLIDAHKLPTPDDVDNVFNCLSVMDPETELEDYNYMKEQLSDMLTTITNFVNYHIQDNSVFVEGEEHSNDVYESACLDTTTNRFVKLYVNYSQGGELTVLDNTGNTRRVNPNLCNVLTRQYYFNGATLNGAGSESTSEIYSSSYAVIHQIDAPLVPFLVDEKHPRGSYYSPEAYQKVYEIIEAHPVTDPTPTPTPNSIKRKRR